MALAASAPLKCKQQVADSIAGRRLARTTTAPARRAHQNDSKSRALTKATVTRWPALGRSLSCRGLPLGPATIVVVCLRRRPIKCAHRRRRRLGLNKRPRAHDRHFPAQL